MRRHAFHRLQRKEAIVSKQLRAHFRSNFGPIIAR